ncbi:alpha/beta hydrolase [Henriciella litoralis]|uniref:alpha/beta hydrolase n=1 Tax=Henriciella litoralis TaxID=568102 RepID=UPI000A062D4E|nr:alpha/beta hydrolase [Henriciella litoralis]
MALDETIKTFMDRFKLPDFSGLDWKQSTDRLRQSFYRASQSVERDAPELADISTMAVDGADGPLKGRLYTPLGAGIGPGPGIIFFHGGGFVLGDLDSHDMICRRLATGARCRVLSVHYRLAPEHPFPAAHDDAIAIWQWANRRAELLNMDPDRLCVAGDSAGGNLAAYLCQHLNRAGEPAPAFQLLLYPLVQFVDIRTKKLTFQEGFFLSEKLFDYFRDAYIHSETDRMDPRVSPLFAPDGDFRGLPPAHMVLCGWDPLKDEGHAYAAKLSAHGVPVTIREHSGMVHGFMNLTAVSVPARDAIQEAGEVVGNALGAL